MNRTSHDLIAVPEIKERIVNFNFMALFGAVVFLFFALDFYIPVLPFYVIDTGGGESAVGLLMGLFTLCSVVLRPFQGRNLNQRGRKRLLITGIALYAVSGMALMILPPLSLVFIFRAIQGLGWGAFLLAYNTLTLDLAPAGRRGEALGLMGIAPPLSLAAAPVISEQIRIATDSNYLLLFFIASVAALLALFSGLLVKEPSFKKGGEKIAQGEKAAQAVTVKKAPLLSRNVFFPSLIIFFMTFTLGSILTFLPLLGETRDIQAVGYFFTIFALTTVFSRPAAGRLSDRLGRSRVFLPGLLIASAALIMIALAYSAEQLLISAFILGLGFGASHSSVMAMAADKLSIMERGVGMATFTAAFDLGIVAGSSTLGILLNWFDFKAVFMLCALVMLFPVLLYAIRNQMRPAN